MMLFGDHQIRFGLPDLRHRIRSMNRLDDLVTGALERVPDHEPHVRLIIDDQHSRHQRFITCSRVAARHQTGLAREPRTADAE
jgi:hypothetical protein